MENIIYCFSAHGNSLKIAMDISKRLGNTEIVPIRHDTFYRQDTDIKRIGIITPVIYFGLPICVKKFIEKMPSAVNAPYFFAIATNGGMAFATEMQIENKLRKNGYRLSSSFLVKFELGRSSTDVWESEIDNIAYVIKNQKIKRPILHLQDKIVTTLVNPLADRLVMSNDKNFQVNRKCDGCGVCEKICPTGNIRMTNGLPVWQHHCIQCGACFCWCPQEAILGKNLAAKTRYTNSDISLDQMLS